MPHTISTRIPRQTIRIRSNPCPTSPIIIRAVGIRRGVSKVAQRTIVLERITVHSREKGTRSINIISDVIEFTIEMIIIDSALRTTI